PCCRTPHSTLFPYTTLFRSRTQLLQAGEREFHIGLHTGHLDAAKSCRQLGHVLQQCGLADASLAAEHHHLTGARLDSRDQPPKRSEEHTSELQSRVDLVCRL